jgi:hypothetical protein
VSERAEGTRWEMTRPPAGSAADRSAAGPGDQEPGDDRR